MLHAPSRSTDAGAPDSDVLDLRFLHRPIVFLEPDRAVHPPSWLDYTPFAFWIVDALRPLLFVELGCQSGNSYAAFAQAVQTLGLSTVCYGVDTWHGDPHAGFFDESVFEDWSAYHDRRFSTFSRLIRASFDDALEQFSSGSIDLLHIDGYHTFEAVSHDFEAWCPKLSERGVVLCHDINVREEDFGAWRLWERLKDEHPSFAFQHGHGLGVLGIGTKLPEPVRWLLSLEARAPDRANHVRLFFSRLGAAVLGRYHTSDVQRTLRHEMAERDARLARAAADVDQLRAALEASERQLTSTTAELTRVTGLCETNGAALATRTADVERLASVVAHLQERARALSGELQERDGRHAHAKAAIARLRNRLEGLKRRTAAADANAVRLRAALKRARATIADRTADVGRLALEAKSRDCRIGGLEQALGEASRAQATAEIAARTLDADAGAALQLVQRGTEALGEEGTRRRRLESLVAWSRAQLTELWEANASRRTRDAERWQSWASAVSAVLRLARQRRVALGDVLRLVAMPDRLRDFLTIRASGLFDEAYYLAQNPNLARGGLDPLVHFLMTGAADGRDPHPLFSTAFYVGQLPGSGAVRENPLVHYLTRGWREGYAPHPIFDPAHYLSHDLEVARRGSNPLLHYLEHGARARLNPHPLFDVEFYLHENADVRDLGLEPLTHFVVRGAREGRAPSPWFDCARYLERYPDVAASGVNALEHFLQIGWREGMSPSAAFDVEQYLASHPGVRASDENPLVHYVLFGHRREGQAAAGSRALEHGERVSRGTRIELSACSLSATADAPPTIVVVSHVGPWRPRAGNEYRIDRMLRWYQHQQYRIVLLIAPLPGEEVPREGLEAIAASFGNVIQVHHNGTLEYILPQLPDVLASLNGTFTPSFTDLLGEDRASPRERELLAIDRSFCHDAIVAAVLHLQRSLGPHVLQVEYIWMTRLLPLVRGDVLKVIDTHDVFSSIEQKVSFFGVHDVVVTPQEEAERLRRADLVLAIQDDERAALSRLVPSVPIITAGVDFDVVDDLRVPMEQGQILYVASNNARNRKGLDDFLRLAWRHIRRHVPHAELVVVGGVADALADRELSGVRVLGPVGDLTARYQQAALVINPVVAGTGLKIKTLEALCHLRPVVTWPGGIDGLAPELAACCLVAHDWYEFSQLVVGALGATSGALAASARDAIADLVAPDHVYGALDAAYRTFFERPRPAPEPIGTANVTCVSRVAHARD